MTMVSTAERNYRYLLEPAWGPGQFSQLLKEFEVSLPDGLGLADVVDLGWLRPQFRVALPPRYVKEWHGFPQLGQQREIRKEHIWADHLAACWGMGTVWDSGSDPDWFEHPFDCRQDDVVCEIWRHTIPTGPGTRRPNSIPMSGFPDGVRPWVDAYAYWQVYEVVGVLGAAELCGPIWNGKRVASRVSWLKTALPRLRKFSAIRLQHVRRLWADRAPAFEWLSRYRTLQGQGVWKKGHGAALELEQGTRRLIGRLGLSAACVKKDIKDVFVRVWHDVPGRPKLRELIRQDIYRALDLLTHIPGESFSWDDPFWDRLQLLREILPFEGQMARRHFEERAHVYLDVLPSLVAGKRYDKQRFVDLATRFWGQSVQFRRFCHAYARMHRDLGPGLNEGKLVWLAAQTPVDHFLLCTLVVEKLLAALYQAQTGSSKLPGIGALVRHTVDRVERMGMLTGVWAEINKGWARTKLNDLALTGGNPLRVFPQPLAPKEMVVTAFWNFVVLRNYFAHHDVLDDVLPYSDMGWLGMRSLLLVVVLTLAAS